MKTPHKLTNLFDNTVTETLKDKVIFFYEKDSLTEVFAFFPDEKDYSDPGLHTSYAHIGQHSSCHVAYTKECKLASPVHYLPLQKELQSIGYNLIVLNEYFVEYHREPTPGEIKFGEGATHYKDFYFDQCYKWHPHQLKFKTWLKCPEDGLRYYR